MCVESEPSRHLISLFPRAIRLGLQTSGIILADQNVPMAIGYL